MMTQLVSSFGAGLLASLTPCVYPLVPITLGMIGARTQAGSKLQTAQRLRIFLFFLGQAASFVSLGVIAATLGESFGFSSEFKSIRVAVGVLLIVAGIVSWRGVLPSIASSWNRLTSIFDLSMPIGKSLAKGHQPAEGAANPSQKSFILSLLLAFSVGIGSALVASPCSSPILGGVLALLASRSTLSWGATLMFVYSMGFSLLFLGLGFGFTQLSRIPKSGDWMIWVHRLSSALLIATGLFWLVSN